VTGREALLAVAAALVLFVGLGATGLSEPDEPRHGPIAEEMRQLRHGPAQLVVPRLNDEVYTQKPPLYYWLAALAGVPAGRVTEAAARLPSALAGLGTVLVAARLGASTFGAGAGLAAGAVLLTLPSFVDDARCARPDALLAFFVTLALAFAWRLDAGPGDPRRARVGLHGAVGLGMLAKGPVALLLPALGVLAWLAWERRLRDARRFVSAPALALSLGPIALWLAAAVALAPPGYLEAAVGENVFARFFSGTDHEQSIFYHLRSLPLTYLPWTLAWPLAFLAARAALAPGAKPERARATRFLAAFVGAGVAFFSLSAGKRDVYLLPLYPALAVLVGEGVRFGIERGAERGAARRWRLAGVAFAAAVAAQLAYHALYLPSRDAGHSIRTSAEAAAAAAPAGSAIGLVRNGALIGGLRYYARRPVEAIGSTKGLHRFLDAGGRVVVTESRYLPEIESVAEARVAFRQQLDEDEVLVLELRPREPAS
jgi:4-amino-4-deoxy-L-arabinose transferase-like glycosyltransferase